ncbi:FAS1 domain-containing protein [Phanerochaete sordida]|uniref:FAS1 domain-containing protein n=1 Tax=Phanerochaete sordida TaxID=48140 RepID=A0A9P3GJI8_9APHY|nr:FAS1 domain-containing protein [Phanerochaete sordida]
MLARSLAALLAASLAVAAVPNGGPFVFENDVNDVNDGQWVMDALRRVRPAPPEPPRMPGPPPHLPHPGPPHDPHHAPHHPKVDDKTIFQALESDERFSRVFKLVNISDEVTALLNDSSQAVTFFAPPDRALKPPKRHGGHAPRRDAAFDEFGVEDFFGGGDVTAGGELELFAALEGFVDAQLLEGSDDDDDKERKHKIIKKIVTAVLQYHVLPGELSAHELAKNTTYPTALTLHEGSFAGQPLRLRVEQPPRLLKPTLSLNFYAKVLFADVQTKNGVIHVVNHPLFPPPSIFTTLFAFSDHFSTLTSAIQRVNFTDAIDWHWVRESKTLEGSPALTFFAPTNFAFKRLPPRLKFFLFSPFGHHVLKKILAFHTVPDIILHTNYFYNASDEDAATRSNVVDAEGDYYDQIPTSFEWEDIAAKPKPKQHSREEALMGQLRKMGGAAPLGGHGCAKHADEDWHWDQERARPERDGYGFVSGEYQPDDRRPPPPPHGPHPHPHPPPPPPPPEHAPHPPHLPTPKPVWHVNGTLPTLLANHTLAVHVAQFHTVLPHKRYATVLAVNGHVAVRADVPARNGAVHVVSRLISPRKHDKHHDADFVFSEEEAVAQNDKDWEEWEEWLPQWAAED